MFAFERESTKSPAMAQSHFKQNQPHRTNKNFRSITIFTLDFINMRIDRGAPRLFAAPLISIQSQYNYFIESIGDAKRPFRQIEYIKTNSECSECCVDASARTRNRSESFGIRPAGHTHTECAMNHVACEENRQCDNNKIMIE